MKFTETNKNTTGYARWWLHRNLQIEWMTSWWSSATCSIKNAWTAFVIEMLKTGISLKPLPQGTS